MKNTPVTLLLLSVATLTASSAYSDKCGPNDRAPLPTCASQGRVDGTKRGLFVQNSCSFPITVKFDKSGGDVRKNVPAGKRIDQVPLPDGTTVSCCPKYSKCVDPAAPPPSPSPSAGLSCGKKIRLKAYTGVYLTRLATGTGLTVGPVSNNAVWAVECTGTKVLFKSALGDYLHRPEGNPAVTVWTSGVGNEWTSEVAGSAVRLKSWKGDYLHFNANLTTYSAGSGIPGSDWIVETL